MAREENYIEHALHVGEELTGLTREQLGFEPRPEDLTEDQRSRLDPDDLEWMDSITPERRDKSFFQAELLAGGYVLTIDRLWFREPSRSSKTWSIRTAEASQSANTL